jgi:hypothetical protein
VLGALARESQGFFVALKLFFGYLSRCFATILYFLPFYLNKTSKDARARTYNFETNGSNSADFPSNFFNKKQYVW